MVLVQISSLYLPKKHSVRGRYRIGGIDFQLPPTRGRFSPCLPGVHPSLLAITFLTQTFLLLPQYL